MTTSSNINLPYSPSPLKRTLLMFHFVRYLWMAPLNHLFTKINMTKSFNVTRLFGILSTLLWIHTFLNIPLKLWCSELAKVFQVDLTIAESLLLCDVAMCFCWFREVPHLPWLWQHHTTSSCLICHPLKQGCQKQDQRGQMWPAEALYAAHGFSQKILSTVPAAEGSLMTGQHI